MLKNVYPDILSLCSGPGQTAVRIQENRSRRVVLKSGNLVQNARAESSGCSASVVLRGAKGFCSIADLSPSSVEKALRTASENAEFLSKRAKKEGAPLPLSPGQGKVTPYTVISDAAQKKLIDVCRAVDDYIVSRCPGLTGRTVVYTEDSQDKILFTSDAFSGQVVTPRCYVYVFLSAETKEGVPLELFRAFGGAGSFEDNFSDLSPVFPGVDELYRRLCDKKEGEYADAGVRTVILGGTMTGMLSHEAVGHTVEADLVRGGSVAGKLLNCRVASDLVTMVDFASSAFGARAPLPVFLDDEGIPAKDVTLIENGILKGYMHSRESAGFFGVPPTGNARAWAFSDEPLIRMRNTALLPGRDKLSDMIASVEDGYYLIQTGNGQADLTGEFMFGVTMGYRIKNGKLGKAILDTTVSGVAFDMLKTVDMVSDEVEWSSSGFCGKKQRMPVGLGGPAVRCKMMIGGR